jgi:hypothetical protein
VFSFLPINPYLPFLLILYILYSAAEMTALRELDVRGAKKQVCKITPEVATLLRLQRCKLRGGVIKKGKKGKGGGKKKK